MYNGTPRNTPGCVRTNLLTFKILGFKMRRACAYQSALMASTLLSSVHASQPIFSFASSSPKNGITCNHIPFVSSVSLLQKQQRKLSAFSSVTSKNKNNRRSAKVESFPFFSIVASLGLKQKWRIFQAGFSGIKRITENWGFDQIQKFFRRRTLASANIC